MKPFDIPSPSQFILLHSISKIKYFDSHIIYGHELIIHLGGNTPINNYRLLTRVGVQMRMHIDIGLRTHKRAQECTHNVNTQIYSCMQAHRGPTLIFVCARASA